MRAPLLKGIHVIIHPSIALYSLVTIKSAAEYGNFVRGFEITELTTTSYKESPVKGNPVLKGSGSGWNAGGMHHMDIQRDETGRWIGCIDGWTVEDNIAEPTWNGWRR